jgi:hypothetical protein
VALRCCDDLKLVMADMGAVESERRPVAGEMLSLNHGSGVVMNTDAAILKEILSLYRTSHATRPHWHMGAHEP